MRKWDVIHKAVDGNSFADKTIVEADDLHITQTGCLVFKRWFDVDAHSNTLVYCKIFSPSRWVEVHLQEEAAID